ncbi:MAG: hypothetical protein SHS37scaffold145_90 [Phage 71_18]|nr:MAG: hypothetical protein SHS37scaffold145_90 [Phage 71_18]
MPEPRSSTCQPWATVADVCAPCDDYAGDAVLLDDCLQIASDLLFQLSGRQFPGVCEVTVRPWAPCACNSWLPYGRNINSLQDFLAWRIRLGGACSCTPYSLDLGDYPIVGVSEVKVDGVVIDPGDGVATGYRIDNYRSLVRLPDPVTGYRGVWPCCPVIDLPDTAQGTFSVTYSYGQSPPPGGVRAAATLGCQLALACISSNDCRLPQRVQSITRQGVSMVMLDPFDFLEDGKTGLFDVDLWLRSVNPGKLARPPAVLSPDDVRFRKPTWP